MSRQCMKRKYFHSCLWFNFNKLSTDRKPEEHYSDVDFHHHLTPPLMRRDTEMNLTTCDDENYRFTMFTFSLPETRTAMRSWWKETKKKTIHIAKTVFFQKRRATNQDILPSSIVHCVPSSTGDLLHWKGKLQDDHDDEKPAWLQTMVR